MKVKNSGPVGAESLPPLLSIEIGNTKETKIRGEYAPTIHLIPKDKAPGRFIVGEYIGSRSVDGEYQGKANKSFVHRFKLKNTNAPISLDREGDLIELGVDGVRGKEVGVWGFGQMDKFVAAAKVGDTLGVYYTGKKDGYHQGRFWNLTRSEEVPF